MFLEAGILLHLCDPLAFLLLGLNIFQQIKKY